MAYTTIDDSELYFQTKLFSGTGGGGGSLTLDGSENMQPDMVWSKSRTEALNHTLFDSVRTAGSNKELTPNSNSAEGGANSAGFGYISAFNTNGFTWTAGSTNTENFNKSSQTYAHWCWKAGTSFTNDASSTGIGTIDSTGSVSDTAGFSIVTWTGTGSAGTIKHGLSTAPSAIITFCRSTGYHHSTFHHKNTSAPETEIVYLNLTNATSDDSGFWNDTAGTSSVFSVGDDNSVNQSSETYVAYIFSERQGYFKAGSYIGNGNADGTFVYTGFKPAWVMVKQTNASGEGWHILDNKRSGVNGDMERLLANSPNAESNYAGYLDLLSTGFKTRINDPGVNTSGGSYIYMAFAEQPFVNSKGVPNNAR